MSKERKFWFISLGALALLLTIWWVYDFSYEGEFRIERGSVALVDISPLGIVLAKPTIFSGANDSDRLVVTYGVTAGDGPSMKVLEYQLSSGNRSLGDTDPFSDPELKMLQFTHDGFSGDEERGEITSPTGEHIVKQSFSGFRFRLPYYRLSGYPDAAGPGLAWRNFVTGEIKVELRVVGNETPVAILARTVISAHYLHNLAEIGTWTSDGGHFVIAPQFSGQQEVIAIPVQVVR